MAELPSWGAPGGRVRGLVVVFWVRVLRFSGLFSKHRSRIDAILEPLRSYLRYGRNGPYFVRFRCRLVIQTCQNVERYRRNGLSGDPAGGPQPLGSSAVGWPSPCVCGARLWPTPIAELPCWGTRGSAKRRLFVVLFSFILGHSGFDFEILQGTSALLYP